jgi:hypothetical protein
MPGVFSPGRRATARERRPSRRSRGAVIPPSRPWGRDHEAVPAALCSRAPLFRRYDPRSGPDAVAPAPPTPASWPRSPAPFGLAAWSANPGWGARPRLGASRGLGVGAKRCCHRPGRGPHGLFELRGPRTRASWAARSRDRRPAGPRAPSVRCSRGAGRDLPAACPLRPPAARAAVRQRQRQSHNEDHDLARCRRRRSSPVFRVPDVGAHATPGSRQRPTLPPRRRRAGTFGGRTRRRAAASRRDAPAAAVAGGEQGRAELALAVGTRQRARCHDVIWRTRAGAVEMAFSSGAGGSDSPRAPAGRGVRLGGSPRGARLVALPAACAGLAGPTAELGGDGRRGVRFDGALGPGGAGGGGRALEPRSRLVAEEPGSRPGCRSGCPA